MKQLVLHFSSTCTWVAQAKERNAGLSVLQTTSYYKPHCKLSKNPTRPKYDDSFTHVQTLMHRDTNNGTSHNTQFHHQTITTIHKTRSKKHTNYKVITAVTCLLIYRFLLVPFLSSNNVENRKKLIIKTAQMFIWLNLGCWHDCESRLCCESTLHKHRKGNVWSPNTTKSIFKGFLDVHWIDSPDLFFYTSIKQNLLSVRCR